MKTIELDSCNTPRLVDEEGDTVVAYRCTYGEERALVLVTVEDGEKGARSQFVHWLQWRRQGERIKPDSTLVEVTHAGTLLGRGWGSDDFNSGATPPYDPRDVDNGTRFAYVDDEDDDASITLLRTESGAVDLESGEWWNMNDLDPTKLPKGGKFRPIT